MVSRGKSEGEATKVTAARHIAAMQVSSITAEIDTWGTRRMSRPKELGYGRGHGHPLHCGAVDGRLRKAFGGRRARLARVRQFGDVDKQTIK